jgi:hypothetical protein
MGHVRIWRTKYGDSWSAKNDRTTPIQATAHKNTNIVEMMRFAQFLVGAEVRCILWTVAGVGGNAGWTSG